MQTCHLRIDGIDGESMSSDHRGEIDVLAWQWGVEHDGSAGGPGGGAGRGRARAGDLVFTHAYDKASPLLARTCIKGTHVATAVLTSGKQGEGQRDFLRVELRDVLVSRVDVTPSDTGLVEVVTLSYGWIGVGYKPQDAKGGLGQEVAFAWDVRTGVVT